MTDATPEAPEPTDPDVYDPATVTEEELDLAHSDVDPAPFPDVDEQDQLDDEVVTRTLMSSGAAGKRQRLLNARRLRTDHTFLGVGMCLNVVRGPILLIAALYPTAADAADHSSPFHKIDNPGSTSVPRAAIGFAWNGRAGHTWLELGSGLVSTTDYHENGFEGVALRSKMLDWCGATSWGWGESVNGVDVWPDPKAAPKPQPPEHEFHRWPVEKRIEYLREAASRAHAAGHDYRAHQLRAWADKIAARAK